MPRDVGNSTLLLDRPITDPWTRLGLIPVSPEFVKTYKADYRAKHGRVGGGDRWRSSKFCPGVYDTDGPALAASLERFLTNIGTVKRTSARMASSHFHTAQAEFVSNPAPKELIALAQRVQEQFPEAKITVEKYYLDPILNASIEGEKGCLGVWDEGKLIAIATAI